MIGSIVHHQHDPSTGILIDQQVLQELNKAAAVFSFCRRPGDRVPDPVVPTEEVYFLFGTWLGGWNVLLATLFHPACPQRRIQGQGRFVHKEECEIVSADLFFNRSSSSSASAFAPGSCR